MTKVLWQAPHGHSARLSLRARHPAPRIFWKIALEWKLADFWIGVFWQTKDVLWRRDYFLQPSPRQRLYGWFPLQPSAPNLREQLTTLPIGGQLDIWLCFIPCLPIHITILHPVGEIIPERPAKLSWRDRLDGALYLLHWRRNLRRRPWTWLMKNAVSQIVSGYTVRQAAKRHP